MTLLKILAMSFGFVFICMFVGTILGRLVNKVIYYFIGRGLNL